MENWEDLFEERALEKGYEYFAEDRVLEAVRCDSGYEAVVRGAEDYQVFIDMERGKITAMRCNCPQFKKGKYCKHMAAALYAITEDAVSAFEEPAGHENTKLYSLILGARDQDLREFIYQLACEDKIIANRLWLRFFKGESAEEIRILEEKLNAIFKSYLGLEQFITYWEAGDFCYDVMEFMEEGLAELMGKRHYGNAFDFVSLVFVKMSQVDIDDSEGDLEPLARRCVEGWREALENIDDEAEERRMHQWFVTHLGSGLIDYLEEFAFAFFVEWPWRPVLLAESLKTIDWLIENDTPERLEYWKETYTVCRVHIMELLEMPKEAVAAYQKKYWQYTGIRNTAISQRIRSGDMEGAVELINESKGLDRDNPDQVDAYRRVLVWLYEELGRPEAVKKELVELLVNQSRVELEDFRKLKQLCGKEEWLEIREAIFKEVSCPPSSYPLFLEEEMYERLLKCIGDEGGIYDLDQYEDVLKAECPEGVLELYAAFLKEMAKKSGSRKKYQEITGYLKKMQDYPGGPEKVRVLTADWRLRYSKRRAFIDELEKL